MAKKEETKKTAGKAVKASKAKSTMAAKPAKSTKAPVGKKEKPAKGPAKTEKTFRLEMPQAQHVSIVGCFNGWNPFANLLEPEGDGTWSCTLFIEPGEHEYRFFVDGVWCDDPGNMLRRPNEFGTENCILII